MNMVASSRRCRWLWQSKAWVFTGLTCGCLWGCAGTQPPAPDAKAAGSIQESAGGKEARAWIARADEETKKGLYRQAWESASQALRLEPGNMAVRQCRVALSMHLKEWDATIEDTSQLIAARPDLGKAYFWRGQAWLQKANYPQAAADLERAAKLNPQDWEVWIKWGYCHELQNAYAPAVACYLKAVQIDPLSFAGRMSLAGMYRKVGDYRKALMQLDALLAQDPQDYRYWSERAFVLARLKRLEEAQQAVNRALALAQGPEREQPLSDQLTVMIESGRFEEAETLVGDLRRQQPNNQEWVQIQGVLYARSGREALAVEAYTQLLQQAPNPGILHNRANALARLHRLEEAQRDYVQALALAPFNYGIVCDWGTMYFDHDRMDEALAKYNQVIQMAPGEALGYQLRAGVWSKQKQYEAALADVNKAVELAPLSDYAHYRRALVHMEMKQAKEAQRDLDQALKINPAFSEAYCARGELLMDLHPQQALADLRQSIVLNPRQLNAYAHRALIHTALNQPEQALQALSEHLALFPRSPEGYYRRGDVYLFMRRYDKAISDLDQALALQPDHFAAFTRRGYTRAQMAQYDQAIADYTAALKLNPRYVHAFLQRGAAYAQKQEFELALADSRRAAELEPNDFFAWNGQAYALEHLKRYDEAIPIYLKAQQQDPQQDSPYFGLTLCYVMTQRPLPAIEELTKLLKLKPNHARALGSRARCLALAQRYEEAWADAEKAQSLGWENDPKFMQDLRKRLGR